MGQKHKRLHRARGEIMCLTSRIKNMNTSTKTETPARQEVIKNMRANAIRETRVAVIGLGYIGLPLALRADRRGHLVVGLDVNLRHIDRLKSRVSPDFLRAQDAEAISTHKIDISSDHCILSGADVFIICVPTSVSHTHEPDLGPLIQATEAVAPYLTTGSLLIVESTVNPGVCDEILLPLIKERTGLIAETDFLFAYCPEQINLSDTKWDVRTIPRVLGSTGTKSTRAALTFYTNIIDAPMHLMQNVKEAETAVSAKSLSPHY